MAIDSSASNPLLMQEIPQTMDQLMAKVGELFHCMIGPQYADFEIPLPSHQPYESGDLPTERFVYVSLAWRTETARDGAEARLVAALLEPFIDARRQLTKDDPRVRKPLLFWRRRPELMESESGHKMTKVLCRVVIPGANLSAYAHKEGELIAKV